MHRRRFQVARQVGPVAVVSLALSLAACVEGAGEPCQSNLDCLDGLACIEGACDTCGSDVACVGVDLVLKSCDPAIDPMKDATVLRVRVTELNGDGVEVDLPGSPKIVAKAAGSLEVPSIPLGKNRRISVEALTAEDAPFASARGATGLFSVTAEAPVAALVVYMRKLGAFSPIGATTCNQMAEARAGHSATTLEDGTVLIAGGYTWDSAGRQVALKSAEIYDPRRGTFTKLPSSLAGPRAFHTASLIPGGRVLLAGGLGPVNGRLSPLLSAELYDPTQKNFSTYIMKKPRYRHAASVVESGLVLITGGVNEAGESLPYAEVFFPNERGSNAFQQAPNLKAPRADHASAAVGSRVFVLGGTDEGKALSSIEVYSLLAGTGTFTRTEGAGQLAIGRGNPLAVPLQTGEGAGLLVLGAPSGTVTQEQAFDFISTTEAGTTPPGRNVVAVNARKQACAAGFAGGAIVVGGRHPTSDALVDKVDAYLLDFSGGPEGKIVARSGGSLDVARASLACTTLADGSVLVTGGEFLDQGKKKVAETAEIYQP